MPLLEVKNLHKDFPISQGVFARSAKHKANNDINLKLGPRSLLEPELLKYYKTFDNIEEIK